MSDDLVKRSIEELQEITRCHCHPAYIDRGRHSPECHYDSSEAVKIVADRIEQLAAINEELEKQRDRYARALHCVMRLHDISLAT